MGLFDWISNKAHSLARSMSNLMGNAPAHHDTAAPPADASGSTPKRRCVNVLIHSRQGSMFLDDDGDTAHEFYEESAEGKMVQVVDNLRPQGSVALPVPRLNPDLRIVLCAATDVTSTTAPAADGGERERATTSPSASGAAAAAAAAGAAAAVVAGSSGGSGDMGSARRSTCSG